MNKRPAPSVRSALSPEEKGKLAIRLLRKLARYDATLADRMREQGLDLTVAPDDDDPAG